jgi:hypothetical protein
MADAPVEPTRNDYAGSPEARAITRNWLGGENDRMTAEIDALVAQARTAAIETVIQWHVAQAKISRQRAMQYPEDSDDRVDLLSEAVWHYDCLAGIRALARPTGEGGK